MVVTIGDDKLTDPVNCHTGQTVKFSLCISVTTKFLDEDPIGIKDLNAVVGGISDDYGIVRTDRDAAGPRKASGLAPPTPDLELLAALLQVLAPRRGTGRCRETW